MPSLWKAIFRPDRVLVMPAEKCLKFEGCNAILCPMDEDNHKHIWFVEESICKLTKYQSLSWIKKQKQIARKVPNIQGYFTIKSLEEINMVRNGLKGDDPDLPLVEKPPKASKKRDPKQAKRK